MAVREVFVFPDMLGGYGVEDSLSVEERSRATGGRLDFVRAVGYEFGC